MILQDTKNQWIHSSFETMGEVDLYYSLRKYLQDAGILENIPNVGVLLQRYCKMQKEWINLMQEKPRHYMCDKMAGHLQELEKELCLTPASMQKYKKDKVLIQAKQQKIKNSK